MVRFRLPDHQIDVIWAKLRQKGKRGLTYHSVDAQRRQQAVKFDIGFLEA